jgi:methionyl-tRNA formyltransferase
VNGIELLEYRKAESATTGRETANVNAAKAEKMVRMAYGQILSAKCVDSFMKGGTICAKRSLLAENPINIGLRMNALLLNAIKDMKL